MKKFSIYILACLALAALLKTGCSDINNSNPSEGVDGIKSVVPARAPYGARVVISGQGFGEVQQVLFNGTEANIEAASDSAILTKVPLNATSGPIEVISLEETFTGPPFTVDSTKNLFLSIEDVFPTQVRVMDTVRIRGTGFNSTVVEESIAANHSNSITSNKADSKGQSLTDEGNKMPGGKDLMPVQKKMRTVSAQPEVFFNEIPATTISVSDSLILTEVPANAESGLISVIVEADTAIGPEMTILRHIISDISPTSGTVGTEVIISGSDFSESPAENGIAFGGAEAPVISSSSTELTTEVPEGAVSGAVTVTINDRVVTGPEFTVESPAPVISSIDPEAGLVGTEVTINGSNFGSSIAENTVTFNGTEAPVLSASETQIVAEVPEGASDGVVRVEVGGETVTGPVFDVITEGALLVEISTAGADIDPDGYLISLNGAEAERVAVNDTLSQTGLIAGSYEISISDIESNCFVTDDFPNPRTVDVSAGQTTTIEYNISCEGTNEPPVAVIENFCLALDCGFTGTSSSDPNGEIVSYNWDFGDGVTASGDTVNHTYETEGVYEVELIVTDNDGATDATVQNVDIMLPQITGIDPVTGPIGTEVTITGTGFSNIEGANAVGFTSGDTIVQAELISESTTEIVAIVPTDATSGPVYVAVGEDYTTEGPVFTVEQTFEPKTLEVTVSTEGPTGDGYTLLVTGRDARFVEPNSSTMYSNILENEVSVELSGLGDNCTVEGENPRLVNLDNSDNAGFTTFNVFCSSPAPTITSIDPDSGEYGSSVIITGTNFSTVFSENNVQFNGTRAELNSVSNTTGCNYRPCYGNCKWTNSYWPHIHSSSIG